MKCENCYGTVAEMLAKKDAEIDALNKRIAAMSALLNSIVVPVTEVIIISDRDHESWAATKAAINEAKRMGYK
jgi:hypothetical protein